MGLLRLSGEASCHCSRHAKMSRGFLGQLRMHEAVIPRLLEKLEAEKDELFQYAIIDVFTMMSVKSHLRAREDVINRIRQVVVKMKISTFREMAQRDLNEIEKNSVE